MRSVVATTLAVTFLIIARAAAEEPVATAQQQRLDALLKKFRDSPQKAAQERAQLRQERNAATKQLQSGQRDARDTLKALPPSTREQIAELEAQTQPRAHSAGFLQLIQEYPRDPVSLNALEWLLEYDEGSPATTKALAAIDAELLESESLARVCSHLANRTGGPGGDAFLKIIVEKNSHRLVQATARRVQALRLVHKTEWAKQSAAGSDALQAQLETHRRQLTGDADTYDPAELIRSGSKKAEELFNEVLEKYGDVTYPSGRNVKDIVESDLRELKTRSIGCQAPEIEGLDMDEKPMKLSDARGQIVVLEFWGTWCGPCMALMPEQIKFLERMEGKPVMLLGVNSDKDRQTAKKRSDEHGIFWRSWFDGDTKGPISTAWNCSMWPTLYLIDAKGTIRFKGSVLRRKGNITDVKIVNGVPTTFSALDDCVNLLLAEMEPARASAPVNTEPLLPAKARPPVRFSPWELADTTKLAIIAACPEVQEELKLSGDTANQLSLMRDEYLEAVRRAFTAEAVSPRFSSTRRPGELQNAPVNLRIEDSQKKFEIDNRIEKEFEQKIKELVTDEQFKRLKQIRVQALGDNWSRDRNIYAALSISEEQRRKRVGIMNEYSQKMRDQRPADLRTYFAERDKKANDEMLSPEQKAKLEEMRGMPFDVSKLSVLPWVTRPSNVRAGTEDEPAYSPSASAYTCKARHTGSSTQRIAGAMVRLERDAKTGLTNVHFGQQFVSAEHLKFLKNQPNLGNISIYTHGTPVSDDDLQEIASLPIAGLDLAAGQSITDRGLAAFKGHASLRSLGLHRTQVTTEGLEILLTIHALESVYFADSGITDAGLAKLGQIKALKSIDFRGCPQITDEGMESLCRCGTLESVFLAGNKQLTSRVTRFLRSEENLNWLGLYHLPLEDSGAEQIAAMSHLTTLLIGDCGLTDVAAARLAQLTGLKSLKLREPALTDRSVAALAGLSNLESLTLESVSITDVAMPDLLKPTKLKSLALWGTSVTGDGLAVLARLTNLKKLDLTQTKRSNSQLDRVRRGLTTRVHYHAPASEWLLSNVQMSQDNPQFAMRLTEW